jgi:eukaryotic-like serine/threonine-protein kinase
MSAPARLGRYRVERRIGSGAFATVWLARDEVLEAPVAVKVLAENWAHHLDVRERFLEEARILRRADSDRVVRVHDIGELEDGRPYFVMTYADRGTLADRLAAGPLPVGLALRWGADVARGLAVLHEVGVIHRDLNPGNVLLRSDRHGPGDRVLVADLGLAKAAAHGSGFTLTVGTPGYVAPEQASPGAAGLDRRADVYSAGALLHHLLTGVAPAPDEELRPPHELRPDVPERVDAVVRQATAPRPEDRFPSAGALADALDGAAIAVQARSRPGPRSASVAPPHRRPDRPPDGPGRGAGPLLPRDRSPGAPRALAGRPDPSERRTGALRAGGGSAAPDAAAERSPAAAAAGATADAADRGRGSDRPGRDSGAGALVDDTRTLRIPRVRRRGGLLLALGMVLLLAAGAVFALVLRDRATVTVRSASGLAVTVPAAWGRQYQESVWELAPYGLRGRRGTALAVASDLASWRDPTSRTPGVFVGTAAGLRADALLGTGPARACPYVEDHRTIAGMDATVRRHESCAGSPSALVEAVLVPTGGGRLVFVQVKEPASAQEADRVLASVVAPAGN